HEGVDRGPAGAYQELERVVEARGVASRSPDHGLEAVDRVTPDRRGQRWLARLHGVAVPPQRVDLAVVRQQPERLRQRPARQRVPRVAPGKQRAARLTA